jgi:hypothetical protein
MVTKKLKSKQKKGPKGKKARAKAKLEQVWGESYNEEERKAGKIRIGKSRLLRDDKMDDAGKKDIREQVLENGAKQQKKKVRDQVTDSSDSESEDDAGGNSFTHLLKRIRRSDDRMNVSDDSDDSAVESEDEEQASDDDGKSTDEESINIDLTDFASEDPYEAHFSKAPLPQVDFTKNNHGKLLVPLTQHIKKVGFTLSNVEVTLSGPLLETYESIENAVGKKEKSKSAIRKIWKVLAKGPFSHARTVLTRNWNGDKDVSGDVVGQVFSSLQLGFYPAVARYADVLLTVETRQVCDFTLVMSCFVR